MGLYMPLESNAMVEEWMLLANVTVAKRISEHFPHTALLRRHPHPQAADFACTRARAPALDPTLGVCLGAEARGCCSRGPRLTWLDLARLGSTWLDLPHDEQTFSRSSPRTASTST